MRRCDVGSCGSSPVTMRGVRDGMPRVAEWGRCILGDISKPLNKHRVLTLDLLVQSTLTFKIKLPIGRYLWFSVC